jgi:hypothetical protein
MLDLSDPQPHRDVIEISWSSASQRGAWSFGVAEDAPGNHAGWNES